MSDQTSPVEQALQAQVDQLTADLKTVTEGKVKAEKELAKASGSLSDATSVVTDLQAQLKTVTDAKVKAEADLAEARLIITDQEARLKTAEAVLPKLALFTHQKKQYELVTEFNYKGEIVTLDLLKTRPELVKELLRESVSLVREVGAE